MDGSRHRLALAFILAGSFALRLHHIDKPLLDGMAVKQIYVAQKARAIAGPPFNLLNNSFDFLTADGKRLALTEEAPFYTGLLAASYRLFGEAEWLGRLISSLATLIAIAALYDLLRRELNRDLALLAAFFFAFSPLLLFYGQAVQPDACMLAGMLLTACCYRRHLDTGRVRWWLAAAACGALAALFKYYGLMVILPLAHMHLRRHGWRGIFSPRLIALSALMAAPVAAWMALVFFKSPNPARTGEYFLFQMPELLWQSTLYIRFFDRFLWKDCGPAMCGFVVAGVVAALLGRPGGKSSRPIWGWSAMAVGFYFLLGPLLRCHDYYEMMMLPAASAWAALGIDALFRLLAQRWVWLAARRHWAFAAAALAIVVLHSPWVKHGKFDWDPIFTRAARSIARRCGPGERVVVISPQNGVAVVHYARREGWIFLDGADVPEKLEHCRNQGVQHAVVILTDEFKPEERAALTGALRELPIVERKVQKRAGHTVASEYYLIRLNEIAGHNAVAKSR
jgi:4-amino-4-deoxy-L-arabinose transferase-like glycosyltransferase